jgi:hypothetical protein
MARGRTGMTQLTVSRLGRYNAIAAAVVVLAGLAAAQGVGLQCERRERCAGPRLDGQDFALLTSPKASAAAAVTKWGDYLKLRLILTNISVDKLHFDPAQVQALTSDGKSLSPVQVAQMTEASHQRFGLGSNPADIVLTDPNGPAGMGRAPIIRGGDGRPIETDPLGHIDSQIQSRHLQDHASELKKLLRNQLTATDLDRGETIAGYVLIPLAKVTDITSVRVDFGSAFQLPLH